MKRTVVVVLLSLLSVGVLAAQTGNVLISWNANTEADLAGYHVYWNNAQVADVKAPAHSWVGAVTIEEGTNEATVDAYDLTGNTSIKSAPALLVLDTTPPAQPTGCSAVRQ